MADDELDFEDAPLDLEDFDDDVEFWRDALPELSDAEFQRLLGDAAALASVVAGVMLLDLFSDAWDAIDAAEADGTSPEDFVPDVEELIADVWSPSRATDADVAEAGDMGSGIDLALDYSTQNAFNLGRDEEQEDQGQPYSRYCAEPDACEEICAPLADTVLPSDDPWWDTHRPQMHLRCRCEKEDISEEEARALGIDTRGPDIDAAPGFGFPTAEWVPDLTGRPPELVGIYQMHHAEHLGPY